MGSALARTLANSTCGGEGIKGKAVRRGAGECKSWRGLPLPEEDGNGGWGGGAAGELENRTGMRLALILLWACKCSDSSYVVLCSHNKMMEVFRKLNPKLQKVKLR
jgi:hypothetical protein